MQATKSGENEEGHQLRRIYMDLCIPKTSSALIS
jgi:hypothetical protein